MPEAQLRIVTGIEKITATGNYPFTAIITHADLIKSAIAYYAGIPLDLFRRIDVSPASVSVIEITNENAHIHCINNTGHIEL